MFRARCRRELKRAAALRWMMPLLAAWAAALEAAMTTGRASAALPALIAVRARFKVLRNEPRSRRLRLVRLMRCRARLAADT